MSKISKTTINGKEVTFVTAQCGDEEFDIRNEHFRLLAKGKSNYLYERSSSLEIVAYEVVTPKGKDGVYPGDNDFGAFGKCYSPGFVFNHPDFIKRKHRIDWVYDSSKS